MINSELLYAEVPQEGALLLHQAARVVSDAQVPLYNPICVSVSVPESVRILNAPDAGQTTLYHTVLDVVLFQQDGIAGSPVAVAQELSPAEFTPNVSGEAKQG